METSVFVAIMTAQNNNQPPPFYASTNKGITKLQLSEEATTQTQPQLLELLRSLIETINKFIEKDGNFKRQLELAISEIRESNGNIADKMDELIRDWNEL